MALAARSAVCSDSLLSPAVLSDAPFAFWPLNEAVGSATALACGVLATDLPYGDAAAPGATLRENYNQPPVTAAEIAPKFSGGAGLTLGAALAETLLTNSPADDNSLLFPAFASSTPNGIGVTVEALVVAEKFAAGGSVVAAVKADGGSFSVIVSCKAARECEASGACRCAAARPPPAMHSMFSHSICSCLRARRHAPSGVHSICSLI